MGTFLCKLCHQTENLGGVCKVNYLLSPNWSCSIGYRRFWRPKTTRAFVQSATKASWIRCASSVQCQTCMRSFFLLLGPSFDGMSPMSDLRLKCKPVRGIGKLRLSVQIMLFGGSFLHSYYSIWNLATIFHFVRHDFVDFTTIMKNGIPIDRKFVQHSVQRTPNWTNSASHQHLPGFSFFRLNWGAANAYRWANTFKIIVFSLFSSLLFTIEKPLS